MGDPAAVAGRYLERNFAGDGRVVHGADEDRLGDRTVEVLDAWFEEGGQRVDVLHQGSSCTVAMRVRFHEAVDDAVLAFLVENDRHDPLFATSSEDGGTETGRHDAGDEATFSVTFDNVFAPGRVFATPWVVRKRGGICDRRERIASAVVTAVHRSGGLVDLRTTMEYRREAREPA